ncbi:serine hydrolase domain-containing protein [Parerythrobacter jejuensis]|uniref:Serine hydrolase n=1 Tax=Parerythrobacter jejuensis TaxID=795812 RepID=A0A845APP9_9SPHN|nr:serine hydrolase domain-containing protein [Parerythrobacter jejuensis]MXP32822.1 serine hydrolase [Parerythrobacter jejuensis]
MAYKDFQDAQLSRRSLLRGGAYLGGAATLASVPFGRAALAQVKPGPWENVAAAVEDYVSNGKVANMLASFGWGQAEPSAIAKGTLAVDGSTAVDMDSLYRIYSMTKPITGMAAMMLIDDGLMRLDQPIAEILPAYGEMMVQKEYDGAITEDNLEPAARPITIRHLLTHTAGLGYGIIQKGPIQKAYEEKGLIPGQVTRLPLPGLGRGKPVGSLEAFADGLAEMPLVLQPGTKWSYSVSLDLLGRVIEVVEKKPFDQVLKERLFDPAGMTSTYFTVPESEIGRYTTNYGIVAGTPFPIDPADSSIYLDEPAFPFGGAGLVCSPRDYDRFLRMLLGYGMIDGTRVMGELAVRVGTSNILPKGVDTEGTWMAGQGFGAGGRVSDGAYGWGGAAGTAAFVHYGANLRAALFTQYMPSDTYPIQNQFPELVAKDLAAMQGG